MTSDLILSFASGLSQYIPGMLRKLRVWTLVTAPGDPVPVPQQHWASVVSSQCKAAFLGQLLISLLLNHFMAQQIRE